MTLLQSLQIILMVLDGGFQLLDIFCPSLTKGGLRLTIPLFPFL
jgi:hypothetical protein